MEADVAGFQRLVRLVARLFYAQEVPPFEELPPEEGVPKRNRPQQAPQPGLGVIVLDALTRREWVQEDYVPKNVEGEPPDPKPPGLAQQLRVHPKLLRRVLRFFEQEQFLAREHRRETARRRRRAGDPVPDAAAASMLAGQTVVEEEESQQRQLTHSYCCIDYPRFVDALQLRLHLMRTQLKAAHEDKKAVQGYGCPGCGSTFTSMDAMLLVDRETGEFRCDECRTPLVQQFEGGQMGDDAERRRRKEASKALLLQFERSIKPVKDLLVRLKDKSPPDFGPLQDWAIEKQREAERQRRLAAKGGNRGGGAALPQFTNVEVDMGEDEAAAAAAAEAAAAAPKVLPPWMLKDGVDSADANVAAAQSAEEAAQTAADREALERAYVQAWLARANALGGASAVSSSQDDKKLVTGVFQADMRESKRIKTEGGWSTVNDAMIVLKSETQAAAADGEEGQLDWQNADGFTKAEPVPEITSAPTPEAQAEDEDEIDWEEV